VKHDGGKPPPVSMDLPDFNELAPAKDARAFQDNGRQDEKEQDYDLMGNLERAGRRLGDGRSFLVCGLFQSTLMAS
jgi:hypothetical protein